MALAAAISVPLSFAQSQPSNAALKQSETQLKQASSNFVENKGQWNKQAKFLSRTSGLDFWVTSSGFLLNYYSRSDNGRNGHVLKLNFAGANPRAKVNGLNQTNHISQYVQPNRPVRNAHGFKDLRYSDLYAGIDLHVYRDGNRPRYDFELDPGANPKLIRMKVEGAKKLSVNSKGELVFGTALGDLKAGDLKAFQVVNGKKVPVAASFKLAANNSVTFALGAYDHSKKLVIDPIIYGSYYGGDFGVDEVRAVVADSDGGVFMTGNTFATDFPLVLGPYISLSGTTDAFVSKFQGDAYVHNYSSYFGGPGDETGKYIAVDPAGNRIWIAGTTSSGTFPNVTGSSFKQVRTGTTDTFLMRWDKDTAQVLVPVYATYFGSTSAGNGEEIKGFGVGPLTGDLFIAGVTAGTGIPGALNAYPGATTNAFITRMNPTGQSVTWSKYIEGNAQQTLGISTLLGLPPPPLGAGTNPGTTNTEANLSAKLSPNALAVDKDENAIISGTVNFQGNQDTGDSATNPVPAFKTTAGVFMDTNFGINGRLLRNNDIFIAKLDSAGGLFYGAVLGGADNDTGCAVAVDALGNAYVTGISGSFDFPRTFGTFGQVFTQQQNVTVTKLNQDCSQIIYSTNLRTHKSPSGALYPVGIAVDGRGFCFVTGMIIDGCNWPTQPGDPDEPSSATTNPGGVPTTADAIRAAYAYPPTPNVPSWDAWLIVLNDTATTQIYGTYVGGLNDDGIFPPYTDQFGDAWIVGWTDLTRAFTTINTTGTTFNSRTTNGNITPFITDLAFKPSGEQANPFAMQNVTTPYGALDESGNGGGRQGFFSTPVPPPFGSGGNLGNFINTARARDGFVMRFRLQIPVITNLVLNPSSVPGGLGASSVGTITLDTPATGAGVDAVVTLSDVSAASFDPSIPQNQIIVNIPAGQTTGTFTVYTSPVVGSTQVDIKASYLQNFKQARLTVVPWLQNFVLSPEATIGGNNVLGRVTLAANAPAGGVDVTLLTDDASFVTFPGGNSVNVPQGENFLNFQIETKGVDQQRNFTVSASSLAVGIARTLTLRPANLLSVTFQPGRVAGGTSSTGTVRLDGLPGPSGFNVDLSINGNPAGYTLTPTTLNFTPNDRQLTFTVGTPPESVNVSRVILANRPAQGTYSAQAKTGTLFVDANFLTNMTLSPTTVNAGGTSTGTVTISNTAQAGGVVINLTSSNPAVASVPSTVVVAAGNTTAQFTVTTAATALDSVVQISAIRGTNTIVRNLTVKGVTFTLSANPTSVIGGATNITGTVTLALAAPVGGVTVTLTSSNPAAASVPVNVVVPQGSTTANFTITSHAVATTQNVTITGQTQPGTTATTVVQIRAISLASVVFTPSYVKGGTVTHVQVFLDAPAPAGGATVTLSSSNTAVLNPGPITVPAGATQSAVITVPVGRVNRTLVVTVTGQYNGLQKAAQVTVYR